MYRFVAFNWNHLDPASTAAAKRLARSLQLNSPELQCVLDTTGLQVFHTTRAKGAYRAYALQHDTGVVLGRLFNADLDGDHRTSAVSFDEEETDQLIRSSGRRLVDRYWGHYVAFVRDPNSDRRFVVRDPTGGLSCFLTTAGSVDVFSSNIVDCVQVTPEPASVNWNHITAFFIHSRLVNETTGFDDVSQLCAGECLTISEHEKARSFYWDPVRIHKANTIEDVDEARAALRKVVRHCVRAWASSYDSIVLSLSGGLDSSIIAACVADGTMDVDVVCFHFFTALAEGDERAYARAAAQSCRVELVETEANASERPLGRLLNPARISTPAVMGFIPAPELLRKRLVNERHAGAVFTGNGGDHLFQQRMDKMLAAEYARRHGLTPQFFKIARNTSRMTKESIWSIYSAAIGNGLLRTSFDPYAVYEAPSFLTDDARHSLPPHAYKHPWVESALQLPASKITQILDIVDCQPFYLQPCPYAEQIHPIISQPIIELVLQIPAYLLAHRGRDRGLVREAFESDVPAKIIHRRSKGGTSSYFSRIILDNADFLRETLLDGALVQNGILNRTELESRLADGELLNGKGWRPVLNAIRAETWLSTWSADWQRTAA